MNHIRRETLFYSWDDYRDSNGFGIVKDADTGRIYGTTSKDNDFRLRAKFLGLFVFQAPFGLFRLTYRIMCLVGFDFAISGYQSASRQWLLERQEASLKSKTISPVSGFYWMAARHISEQLVINIVQIATYLFAVIALEIAALYGIFKPLDGRGLYALIEELWNKNDLYDIPIRLITNASAPCMQPKDVWEDHLWIHWIKNVKPYSHGWYIQEIQALLIRNKAFFAAEGIEGKPYLDTLIKVRRYVNKKDFDATKHSNMHFQLDMIHSSLETTIKFRKLVIDELEKGEDVTSKCRAMEQTRGSLKIYFGELEKEIT